MLLRNVKNRMDRYQSNVLCFFLQADIFIFSINIKLCASVSELWTQHSAWVQDLGCVYPQHGKRRGARRSRGWLWMGGVYDDSAV